MVSPSSGVPLYQQVAELLRAKIANGELAPGEELRSEPDLAHDFGVGKRTIRDALAVLRAEGLVITRRGYRTHVRKAPEVTRLVVPAGTVVTTRMPTPGERQRFDMPVGVPVLVAGDEVYPGDRYAVIMGAE